MDYIPVNVKKKLHDIIFLIPYILLKYALNLDVISLNQYSFRDYLGSTKFL